MANLPEHLGGDTGSQFERTELDQRFHDITEVLGDMSVERVLAEGRVRDELQLLAMPSVELIYEGERDEGDDPGSGLNPRLFPDGPLSNGPTGNFGRHSAGELIAA